MILIIFLLMSTCIWAQTVPPVTISIKRTADVDKKVVVISSESFKNSLNKTFADSGIDIQRNTTHPNISLKGATFQQTSIFIDGVRIDDPQTAHHNLNLPVAIEDIERIEVLSDRGFSGALNIVTKKPKDKIFLEVSAGDFLSSMGRATVAKKWKNTANSFSFERKLSAGYRNDTDYDITNFSNRFDWTAQNFETGLLFGYLKKDFGASGFYSDYPSYERTDTYLSKIYFDCELYDFTVKPEVQWKQNRDKFELDSARPDWYYNKHRADTYTAKLNLIKNNFSLDTGISEEKIKSSNIGYHRREIYSLLGSYHYNLTEKLNADFGLGLDNFNDNSFVSPSLFLDYAVPGILKTHYLIRRSFRVPSFTELYYSDGANSGNPELNFERAMLYETGLDYFLLSFNFFLRDEKDIIDWIKWSDSDTKWSAVNIGTARFYGYEIGIKEEISRISSGVNPHTNALVVGVKYSYTNSSKDADYISKYALRYAHHLLTTEVSYLLPWGIRQKLNGIYKERISNEQYFVLDTKFTKKFSIGEYYIEITNLLDKDYTEIPYVPMPPRIIQVGVKIYL
ncbi:MAG: TonB-dependent receptor plug domain-containing protein [Elusimicrobia bacterium]|nr:TonB-dependent receptor plug domain-containing protein [Elusimicrobiota bacterium]